MTCKEVINEVADDRVWLVAEFGDHAADEHTGAPVPFQIDNAMCFAGAVNFRPAMWPSRPLVLRRDQFESPFELRIAHDLVA